MPKDSTTINFLYPPDALAIAPFTPEEAKQNQQAWAEYLGVPVEIENSIGMKFVLIPPGEFMMGSAEEEGFRPVLLIDPNNPPKITSQPSAESTKPESATKKENE